MLMDKSIIIKKMLDFGIINSEQFLDACQQCKRQGGQVLEVLTHQAGITHDTIIEFFCDKLDYDFIKLSDIALNPEIVALAPPGLLVDHLIIPVFKVRECVFLAVSNPLDVDGLSEIEKYTGTKNRVILASEDQIIKAIAQYIFKPKIISIIR